MFTGLRVGVTTAKVLAQALRVPVIPIPSLDLLAYPLRHARGARRARDRRAPQRGLLRLYRPVPGGVQRGSEYEVGSPDDLAAELEARGEERCCAATARCGSRTRSPTLDRVELAGPAHAAPSWRRCRSWRSRGFEREEFCAPDEVLPLYLRKSDAEIAWDRKGR